MNIKRKIIYLIVTLIIICTFASCGSSLAPVYSPREISEVIIAAQKVAPTLYPVYPGDDYYSTYLSDIYMFDADIPGDGVLYYAGGFEACEIAVFVFDDNSGAEAAENLLLEYKERRAAAFTGYAPEQAALVEQGAVARQGAYVALLLCDAADSAVGVFNACFSKNPPKLPGTEELYLIAQAAPATTIAGAESSIGDESVEAVEASTAATTTAAATATTAATTAASAAETTSTATTASTTSTTTTATTATTTTAATTEAAVSTSINTTAEIEATPTAPTSETTTLETTTETTTPETTTEAITEATTTTTTTEASATTVTEPEPNSAFGAYRPSGAVPQPGDDYRLADDQYDPGSILAAWRSGDASNLSYKNRMILDACYYVINEVITSGMVEYDIELAIHDWIIGWGDYDMETLSNAPDASPDPDNDNPYGLIFGKRAICKGYTYTFQLFMDMVGIECITVEGFAHADFQDHAWNMVRLDDGEWYCVDVTWDDPVSSNNINIYMFHKYFNVTSQLLRENSHHWDETSVPEATATKYAWKPKPE